MKFCYSFFLTMFHFYICITLQVEVGEVVQEGTFGRVLRGVYRDAYARTALNVIIKTVSGMYHKNMKSSFDRICKLSGYYDYFPYM